MRSLMTVGFLFMILSFNTEGLLVSKKHLSKIFSQNAKGTCFNWKKREYDNSSNDMHHSFYNVWQVNNENGAYYKADTLILYNNEYAYFEIPGGKVLSWHFKKKNKIRMTTTNYRNHPPMGSANSDVYKLKLKEKKDETFIVLSLQNKVSDKFKVLNLELVNFRDDPERPMYVMKLKRIK